MEKLGVGFVESELKLKYGDAREFDCQRFPG